MLGELPRWLQRTSQQELEALLLSNPSAHCSSHGTALLSSLLCEVVNVSVIQQKMELAP